MRREVSSSGHGRQFHSLAICAALVLLVAIDYSNALKGEFAFDDKDMIQHNVLIRDLRNVGEIFKTSWWWGGARQQSDEYRPMTVLTFALNYRLNRLSVVGYHVVNVALHAGVVVTLFFFLLQLTRDRMLSGVAAAFFASHPIHTEAINNVVGRAELLAALFFFLSLIAYARFQHTQQKRSFFFYALSLASYFLGLLSKENAVMLLPVLVIYDAAVYRRDAVASTYGEFWRVLRRRLPFYGGYAVVLIVYLVLRARALGNVVSAGMAISSLDNNLVLAKVAGDWTSYYLTAIKVIGYYAYLLIFPLHLSVDYSYNQIPLSQSVADLRVLGVLAVLAASAVCLIQCYRKGRVVPFFAVAFFFLTFLPVSNFFKLIATILGERLLYLPSAGFCLLLAYALFRGAAALMRHTSFGGEAKARYVFLGVAVIIIVLYSARTIARNADWRTELRLFETAARVTPNSARTHFNLGTDYKGRGDLARAEGEFRRAYEIASFYGAPLSGIGEIMLSRGRAEEALKLFQQVIRMEDRYFPAHYYLGRTYFALGRYEEALKEYERTIELRPTAPEPYYAMCEVYFTLQRWADAEQILKRVLGVAPEPSFAWTKLGAVYAQMKRPQEAQEALQKAIQLQPGNAEAYLYLGQFYAAQKRNKEALAAFQRAAELDPRNAEIHLNLARFYYFVLGDGERALSHFRMVLELRPDHPMRQKIIETMKEIEGKGKKD